MRKFQGLGTQIYGIMGRKQGFVANDALVILGNGRNRIYEKERPRNREEIESGRQYGAVLMNPEFTLLAGEEETIMSLPTRITTSQNLSTVSHEGVRWMARVWF